MGSQFLSIFSQVALLLLSLGSTAYASCEFELRDQGVLYVDFSKKNVPSNPKVAQGSAEVIVIVTESDATQFRNGFSEIDILDEEYFKNVEAFISEFMSRLGPGELRSAVSDATAQQMVGYLDSSIELVRILADSPTLSLEPIETALPIIESAQRSTNQLKRLRQLFAQQALRAMARNPWRS